jgi:hypothetical protein
MERRLVLAQNWERGTWERMGANRRVIAKVHEASF